MFAPLILLAAAQAADVAQLTRDLDAALVRTEEVADRIFACMDEQVKEQFFEQMIDATPESVVDRALAACSHLKESYADAATMEYIPPDKAQQLADDWFKSVRDTYLALVEDRMVDPAFAEARTKIGVSEWRKCVTDKSSEWSRLPDEAATIARAAVTACSSFKPRIQAVVAYELQSKKLAPTNAGDIVGSLEAPLEDVAIETVISERAKRLPPS